ncbi:uncharacterized protein [Parasteatoda tepidariorum]|uniref:uncharacterized protein isoform X2 n=1 Tax=Parasteatoda tepidariorum TaxID=114398 RepID=UPI001C721ABB|nr:uncharacterized protein LOC107453446 [Parasteatoda tepidariorum]
MENEENRAKELCLTNDPNASGDSRTVGSLDSYDGNYDRTDSPSDVGGIVESLEPCEMIQKLGSEMKDLFSGWSEGFLPSKQMEEQVLKSMDDLKKQAYMLEAECLENKLEQIKKRMTD